MMTHFKLTTSLSVLAITMTLTVPASSQSSDVIFSKEVEPFFKQHCVRCHGPEKEKGGLRIDQLTADLDDHNSLDHIHNILDELATQSMPPKDEERPDPQKVVEIMQVLRKHIDTAKKKTTPLGVNR